MKDPTEATRRAMLEDGVEIGVKAAMADAFDDAWTTEALQREFTVLGFLAPYVIVQRKSDGVKGTMMFRHSPRVYFDWRPDK